MRLYPARSTSEEVKHLTAEMHQLVILFASAETAFDHRHLPNYYIEWKRRHPLKALISMSQLHWHRSNYLATKPHTIGFRIGCASAHCTYAGRMSPKSTYNLCTTPNRLNTSRCSFCGHRTYRHLFYLITQIVLR